MHQKLLTRKDISTPTLRTETFVGLIKLTNQINRLGNFKQLVDGNC